MCGIAGMLARGHPGDGLAPVRAMVRALGHRGPDGDGVVHDGPAVLGHTRLAVIDPSGGHQPMSGRPGVWIVYNGEVYNSPALREELASSWSFRTTTDTEVVLAGFDRWGERVLDRLRGMFAFAIWDGPRRRLFLARDRIGIKPLLYAETDAGFLFASEMGALLRTGLVSSAIDAPSLHDFLELGFVPSPHTILGAVRRLPPAHYAFHDGTTLATRRYWSLPAGGGGHEVSGRGGGGAGGARPSGRDAAAIWDEAFRRAIDEHRLSDVPIGAFLSGGIDSGLVAAELASMSAGPLPVYTLGFSRPDWDETPQAREIATHLGCAFHGEILGDEMEAEIPAILASLGEPFGDASVIPMWFVSRLAARDVKVALSGDGGDELFAGYTRYQGERLAAIAGVLPRQARAALARGLRALSGAARAVGGARDGAAPGAAARRLARVLDDAGRTVEDRYVAKSRVSENADGARLLRAADTTAEGRAAGIVAALVREAPPEEDAVALLSRLDLSFYLPNDMLFKVDRASMAHSLEVRVPFLDHELVELALGMPSDVKLRGMTTKWLLRQAARRRLPAGASERPKSGFTPPVDAWMRGRTGDCLARWLGEGAGRALERFDVARALDLLEEHRSRRADHGPLLFNLLALAAWERGRTEAAV